MAEKKKADVEVESKETGLIDPIYQKFVRGVTRAIGSTEFYEFFMDSISRAQNEFQFSNRKLIKTVDLKWVDQIEETLEAMQNIISSPRNVIKEEELIVNVANARKAGAETVRHLAQHSALVDNFDSDRGEVRPGRLMQRYREDSVGLYENALVFTTMEYAHHFVKIRHDALFEAMNEEFGAKLKVKSDMETATEQIHMDTFLHVKFTDSALETDRKNSETFERISRIYRMLSIFMTSSFAQQMAKMPRAKGAVTKTNVLKRNPDYRKVVQLWDFLRQYDEIGYTIRVEEQNLEITERLQQDIYRNVMFQYLLLKGYLEDAEERQLPMPTKGRKKTIKPKFIRQIVEELTEDYDLPDVEIRKVLIEELTKEQLMQEEAAERRRLVEEQAQRKKEEEARIRAEKKAEQERIRAEKAAERERIRQEKEAERRRLEQERLEREAEERRISELYRAELSFFETELPEQLELRQSEQARVDVEILDFADAVTLMEEEETRKREEAEREQLRLQEERERLKREQEEAEERERLAREAEEMRIAEEQRTEALQSLKDVSVELYYFEEMLDQRLLERNLYNNELRQRREMHKARLLERREKKQRANK